MQDASTKLVIAEPTAFPVASGRPAISTIGLGLRAGVLFAIVFAAGLIVISWTIESFAVAKAPVTCDAPALPSGKDGAAT